jgi:hypothetical protein
LPQAHDFVMHPQMLADVIKRQAGTLLKALLELVMNGIDAGAPKIDITATTKSIRVTDTGSGMTDKKHILKFWKTFGQPPEEGEKKTYGQFRMGRGQAFAFGKNTWRTSQFQMKVDVQKKLGFDLEEKLPEQKGVDVKIELYEPIGEVDILQLERELTQAIKYVAATTTFNGKVITKQVTSVKWDEESEDFYLRLNSTGNLYIYNLGVLVCSHPLRTYGVGGEVVSRKQLKVNFARNEVMSTCPIWKKIKPIIDDRAGRKIARAPALTDGARERLIDMLLAGTTKDVPRDAKLLADVTGRHWAIGNISPHAYNQKLTVAPLGSAKGDKLHAMRIAFVLSASNLALFNAEDDQELLQILRKLPIPFDPQRHFTYVPFAQLSEKFPESYDIIKEQDWSVEETVVINTIKVAFYRLLSYQYAKRATTDNPDEIAADDDFAEPIDDISRSTRAIYLGDSGCADGWTDGSQFIAIDRKYIKKTGITVEAWISYGQLLIHELCHDDADQGTHIHGVDFYEKYHDWCRHSLHDFVTAAIKFMPQVAKRTEGAYTKYHARQIDRVAVITVAADKLKPIRGEKVRKQ